MTVAKMAALSLASLIVLTAQAYGAELPVLDCQHVNCRDKQAVMAAATAAYRVLSSVDAGDTAHMGHLVAARADDCLDGIRDMRSLSPQEFATVVPSWQACVIGLQEFRQYHPR